MDDRIDGMLPWCQNVGVLIPISSKKNSAMETEGGHLHTSLNMDRFKHTFIPFYYVYRYDSIKSKSYQNVLSTFSNKSIFQYPVNPS